MVIQGLNLHSPVDPVRDVQCPICSQCRQVMCRDGLRLAGALEEEQLGKDGDGLEEDGEGPQEFGDGEPVVEEEREDDARAHQVFDAERIYRGVVCWTAHDGKEGRGLMVEI